MFLPSYEMFGRADRRAARAISRDARGFGNARRKSGRRRKSIAKTA